MSGLKIKVQKHKFRIYFMDSNLHDFALRKYRKILIMQICDLLKIKIKNFAKLNEWRGKQGCHHQNLASCSCKRGVVIFKSLPAGGGASRPASHTSEPPTRGDLG
jgi:hypothetical protein